MCNYRHLIGGLILGAIPLAAQAEDEQTGPVQPGSVITVTGERMPRSLEQTGSSVALITATDLQNTPDIFRLDQLIDLVPNIVLGSGGQGPTIRGQDTSGVLRDLPAFLGGNRPRTTVILDGRRTTHSEFVFGSQPLWDVEKVEIFRSPQTTTQGQNSIAGAVFVETSLPDSDWHARSRAIASSYDARQFSGMITGPIDGQQLMFRISGETKHKRTYSSLSGPIAGIDLNRDEHDFLRFKLQAAPSEIPGLNVVSTFQTSTSQSPQIEGMRPPFQDRRDSQVLYGVFRTVIDSFTLRVEQNLANRTRIVVNGSIGSSKVRRFAPTGLGEAATKSDDQSIEALLSNDSSELGYLLGASFHRQNLLQEIDLSTVGLGLGQFKDAQESFGVFGEVRILALSGVNLTAGARFQTDRQLRAGNLVNSLRNIPYSYEGQFSSFSPKLSLSVEANEVTTMGIIVQRATNPGGATLSPMTGLVDTFSAEQLWDYELFARGKLFNQMLSYSVNLFYYDMRDAQRSVLRGISSPGGTFYLQEIGNVPRSWSKGGELSLILDLHPRLQARAAMGILDTKITRAPTNQDPLQGREFQRSPHFTGSGSISWRPTESTRFELSFSRRSGYFSDDANLPSLRVGAADSLDARAETSLGRTRIFGFIRNLFDSFHLTSVFETGALATAANPREIGVGLEYSL